MSIGYAPPVQADSTPKASRETRAKELLLAVASATLLAGLVLAGEAGLRWLQPSPCPSATDASVMTCLHAYSEVYGWDLRPGIRLCPPTGCITTNALGYRGPAHPRERDAGRTRLLLLGDSVAFGLEVDDDQTLAHHLERSPEAYEVVNLSVPGFGTDQELLKLTREGLAYEPDVVILNFCGANDLVDNTLPAFLYNGAHAKPFFRIEAGKLRLHQDHLRLTRRERLGLWLSERSFLYAAVTSHLGAEARAAEREARRREIPHWETLINDTLREPEPALNLTARLVRRMAELLEPRGIHLLVLGYPVRKTFDAERQDLAGELARRLAKAGIPFVHMGERFRSRGLTYGEVASDGLGHLNPAGHREAALIIRELLAEAQLSDDRVSVPLR